MPDLLAESLCKRYDRYKAQRGTWDANWQEIAEYVLPRKSNIVTRKSPGQKQTGNLFDATAPKSAMDLAAFIASALISPVIRWFSLHTRIREVQDNREVQSWLEDSAGALYAEFRQSNFSAEALEMLIDCGVFGTGCLLLEEAPPSRTGWGGFVFRAEPVGSYVLHENLDGRVNCVIREMTYSLREVARRWGVNALSEKLRDKAQSESAMDDPVVILHGVYPREDQKAGKAAKTLPFASIYCEKETKHTLEESGYHEFPFMVPRWAKAAGEDYGRGPGHTALPDIRTLNKAVELTLKAWAKIIDPPLMVMDDGVIGKISAVPSAINVVRDPNAIQPMKFAADFQVDSGMVQSLRDTIRRTFMADQLQLPDKSLITATEVERRLEMMQQTLGPTLGRLESEFLSPVVDRAFAIMLRARVLPPLPAILQQMQSMAPINLDIRYEGPLARAQRTGDLQAINRTLQVAQALAPLKPDVLDVLDWDGALVDAAKINGFPASRINDPRDVETTRQQRQAQQQQAQMLQAAQMASKTMKDSASANIDNAQAQAQTQAMQSAPQGMM